MGKAAAKARSNTTESVSSYQPRPISRGSTTSVQTIGEHAVPEQSHVPESAATLFQYAQTEYQPPYTQEEMMRHSREQMTNPQRDTIIDPSLHGASHAPRPLSSNTELFDESFMSKASNGNHSYFPSKENTPFAGGDLEQTQDEFVQMDPQKKKMSATSAANDQELKRLYQENKHRNLRNIANAVLAEERGPRSEKTKQIFAMIWLSTVCHKGNGSVPRNRVFSHYATKCGNERVPPLNPASFGKLVRIIFPGILTRRLGMRGESKYHYVDLEMNEDAPDSRHDEQDSLVNANGSPDDLFGSRKTRYQAPTDTAIFPDPTASATNQPGISVRQGVDSQGCLYMDSNRPGLFRGPSSPNLLSRELKFADPNQDLDDDPAINLPSLQSYLPSGTDPDSAESLHALYRAHCIAVIDAFRYCKERVFYHAFTSFHGTLTVPVQKLLAHPNLEPWIKECDWIMYQKMIRYVAHLALQVVPVKVLDTLRTISSRLSHHILNTFQNHPKHVRAARHGPAVIFASLLNRLIRVNSTAHAAANLLTDGGLRNQMWCDWALYVRPIAAVETCLPGTGYTRTLQILTNTIRDLLGPLHTPVFDGMQPIFYETASINPSSNQHQVENSLNTEGILDRWNEFLLSLPSRFPNADARTIIDCVGQVGSAALRDMTMADAKTFGVWWVTKTWLDEMLLWHAEKGGFLEQSPASTEPGPRKRSALAAGFEEDEDNSHGAKPRQHTGPAGPFGNPGTFNGLPSAMQFEGVMQSHLENASTRTGIAQGSRYQSEDGTHQANHIYQSEATNNNQAGQNFLFNNDADFTRHGAQLQNDNFIAQTSTRLPQVQQTSTLPLKIDDKMRHAEAKLAATPQNFKISKGSVPDTYDDSGIGLDLDLPPEPTPLRGIDYATLVGNIPGSDPADVVVC